MLYRYRVVRGDPCPLCGEDLRGKAEDDSIFWAGGVVLGCSYGIIISLLATGDFPFSILMAASFVFGIAMGWWAGSRR